MVTSKPKNAMSVMNTLQLLQTFYFVMLMAKYVIFFYFMQNVVNLYCWKV